MTRSPFFSVLVTAYNRAEHVERCVRSVLAQTLADYELVVVDDASTDATPTVLAAVADPRLRVFRHDRNRGISPARATAVDHACGEWFVVLDSDWELFPHTLARLRALIDKRATPVKVIRSCLRCDDGTVVPQVMPLGITDYRERLRWMEKLMLEDAGADAGHCVHHSVFETVNYYRDRRGSLEILWETDLALHEQSLWVRDILGKQHLDAANSHTRDARAKYVIPRLLHEAGDDLWMAETMLSEHGEALAEHAPHVRMSLLRRAASQAFLLGDRRTGLRHTVAAARCGSRGIKLWATAGLGVLGPRALASAVLAKRRRATAALQRGELA